MATKTVTLTGAELRVDELGGLNALIVNNTDAPLYASAKAGIEPYADGVIEIKAGASRGLPDANGTVYLLGNGGRAEITGTSAEVNFNAPSQPAGGGGEGGLTREEVNSIVSNSLAPIQEELEQKADISEVSNPNLLDNPDFKINQRGQSSYAKAGYTVDRWKHESRTKVTSEPDGIRVECIKSTAEPWAGFAQIVETPFVMGDSYTVSVYVTDILGEWRLRSDNAADGVEINLTAGLNTLTFTVVRFNTESFSNNGININITSKTRAGDYFKLKWVKLESGERATPFVPPHPATELMKCQRYFLSITNGDTYIPPIYGTARRSNQALIVIPTPIAMRVKPSVTISGTVVLFNDEDDTNSKVTQVTVDRWSNIGVSGDFTVANNIFAERQRASLGILDDADAKIFLSADL